MSDRLAPNPLDRAELISLLETLGSDNDEEVLAAARVLDPKVTAAGASWNVLLTTRIGETADEAGDEDGDGAPAPREPLPAAEAHRTPETPPLIQRQRARPSHRAAPRGRV